MEAIGIKIIENDPIKKRASVIVRLKGEQVCAEFIQINHAYDEFYRDFPVNRFGSET